MSRPIRIEGSWKSLLRDEFSKDYFIDMAERVRGEYKNKTIYPDSRDIFNAFDSAPVSSVKVVIIGQDPYHGPGQAHGLCFSVPRGIQTPPSLANIYKELHDDLGIEIPDHGDLSSWARQGVLLLNSVLTVEEYKANSHKGIGWEKFTESAIERLSTDREGIVFILWGRQAQDKQRIIDSQKHLVLTSVHPSPLSAYNGFFGCRHFSKANDYLSGNGTDGIQWGSINEVD